MQRIKVNTLYDNDKLNTSLTAYVADEYRDSSIPKPAILILPGGAYIACADDEGDPIARCFVQMGYTAFVLKYSTLYGTFDRFKWKEENKNAIFPGPLLEVGAAVLEIKKQAAQYGVDPKKLILCGFSAGGHLAASYIADPASWHLEKLAPLEDLQVAACVLSYAVADFTLPDMKNLKTYMKRVTMGSFDDNKDQLELISPAKHVSSSFPPTFIWHTADDKVVPANNALSMAQALQKEKVPFELHIFDHGPHGAGLSEGLPAEQWPMLANQFLKKIL